MKDLAGVVLALGVTLTTLIESFTLFSLIFGSLLISLTCGCFLCAMLACEGMLGRFFGQRLTCEAQVLHGLDL